MRGNAPDGVPSGLLGNLLSNDAIITMVGHEAFARGMVYARNGQVGEVQLDPETMLVSGRVQGSYRDGYDTSVRLVGSEHGWTGHRGVCSCPVRNDCKHAAALLIVARAQVQAGLLEERPAWELALERVVREREPAADTALIPLGVEFGVERLPTYGGRRGRTTLRMRPIRWGSRGSWLRTGISWDELDYPSRRHPGEQRDLLLQLRTAAGASARFGLPRSPWLPLGEVAAGFWTLLAEAERLGLSLLVEGGQQSPLVTRTAPTMVLDARRVDPDLVLEPRILLDGEPLAAERYGLLGDPVHGLYLHDPDPVGGSRSGLTLAQLSEPLSREQRRLLADAVPIRIPPSDEHRFLADYLPAVRRRAVVVSSDGSVALPGIARPQLALAVTFRAEHRVRLDWSVRYPRDGVEHVYALDEAIPPLTLRDGAAEAALVRALPLPYDELPMLGGPRADAAPPVPAAHVLLAAGDAAVFVDRVLPRLEAAGVILSFRGEPIAYRRPTSEPVLEVSATPSNSGSDAADWFDLAIRVRLDGEVVPFQDLFVALNTGDDFLITETGVYVELDRPEFHRLRGLINEARHLDDHGQSEPGASELRLNRTQVGLWDELVDLGVVLGQSDRWLTSVRSLLSEHELSDQERPVTAAPDTLLATLRPYQESGFAWLEALWRHDLGGILADDMGLGKTLQTLALICLARTERPGDAPFLVVAPTSVVSNWAAETARFAPSLRVVTVEAGRDRRRSLAASVEGADVVVTSYALLRLGVEAYAQQSWAGMILDEAQFVKNRRGRTYAAVRRISTGFTLAVTGTPVENNLMDLWALFSLVAPGLFPHPDRFAEDYRRPIERDGDPVRLARLRRRIAPFLLRRTKEAVEAELPPKQEQIVEVVLQPRHQKIYQTYLQRERQKVLGLLDDLDGNRFTILRSLTLLRQLSLDPALVDPQHAKAPASKIDVLVTMLDELLGEGHSALVFSQFTGFLDRVGERLDAERIGFVRLDGRTRDRAGVIERFRAGEARVFLISLKAGGVGLNLTEADYCFVLDPWWNPAAEAQAVDRAHRIGQQRPVLVYRLVARDTIEEKVMALKARKQRLVQAVLATDTPGGGEAAKELEADDIREILELPRAAETAPETVSSF